MNEKNWYTYIVQCNDKKQSLYTGITDNLDKRIKKHNNKKGAKYTKTKTPVKLKKFFTVSTKSQALKLEYYIKSLSRADKINLIDQKFSCPCSNKCCPNPDTFTPEHICIEKVCEDCFNTVCKSCGNSCCCDL